MLKKQLLAIEKPSTVKVEVMKRYLKTLCMTPRLTFSIRGHKFSR